MAHRLTPYAEADLDQIWDYIVHETGNTEIARHQIGSITSRFFLLSKHPHLGRSRDSDIGIGRRSYAVGRYVNFNCFDEGDVLILRVAHGSRDIEALFGR
ncbi:MAG TPA: type II toxin-antitoxin system RelE/ParE family toxin [Candidatus Acidoferrales bacterium]|jgi:toxin ParE1/3/4